MPQKNKPRVYIALCSRGDSSFRDEVHCDSYHWALLIGPDSASRGKAGTRYHVRHERESPKMFYDEEDMDLSLAQMVHVRIAVAKVISMAQLQKALRDLPLHEDDPTWTCLSWVRAAFQKLVADRKALKGYVSENDWPDIEARTRHYVQQKREQRRAQDLAGAVSTIPTWNFWENRETHQ